MTPGKLSFTTLLVFSAILVLPAACLKYAKGNKQESLPTITNSPPADHTLPNPSKKTLPKNWPWRGVCMQSGHFNNNDIEYLHSVGVNFIRIQIKSPKRSQRERTNPTKAFYDELEWTDQVLNECKKYNMTSIIAFNYPVLDPASGIDDKSGDFWKKGSYIDSTFKLMDIIVKRYKDRGDELSAYEVIGEPAIGPGDGEKPAVPPGLELFFKKTLEVIRKYDQQRFFLVTPGPWGRPTNYAKFTPFKLNDPKIIYGAHMYLPNQFTHQGIKKRPRPVAYPGIIAGENWDKEAIEKSFSYLKNFENKTGALVYIGEFQAVRWAPNGNQWVKDCADIMSKNGWSWTYFAYQPDFDFWNPFMEVKNPSESPANWELKNSGRDAEIWQYMIKNHFSKNK